MTNFVQVIKECEKAEGAGTKKAIQAALATADGEAKALITAALNPYMTFGVRLFDPPTHPTKGESSPQPFMSLLHRLSNRFLTGDAARAAVTQTLSLYSAEDAAYLTRVLDKDLRCGFSAETANKVWKEKVIPTFEVMLADKCETAEEFEEQVSFPCQADVKYDGNRTIAIVRAGQPVEYRARSGKPSEHLNGLFDEDLTAIRARIATDFVLDGEAFASDFTETMNAKKEGNDTAKANLRLRAFFMMPLEDWMVQKTSITMRDTRQRLDFLIKEAKCTKVILSEGREVRDYQDMIAYCNEVIDVHKQEGLILKNWNAPYQWARTIDWCKVKRMHDVDGQVYAVYPGRAKSRLEGTLGGICVRGVDEKGISFDVNVGSGFSDEMRAEIWENQKNFIGKTVTIKYQEKSMAKNAKEMSLRFPVFMHVRDDK